MSWTILPSLLILAVATSSVFAHVLLPKPFDILGTPEIVASTSRKLYSNLGAIKSARQCGGQGQFLQWRRETCELTIQGPCVHPPNVYTRGEVSFIPSESSDGLGVRGKILDVNGREVSVFDIPRLESSTVDAGKEYSFLAGVAFGEELRGQLIKGVLEFYRTGDKIVEVCAEAAVLIAENI